MRYLLDTCVFAEYSNPKPAIQVIEWLEARSDESLYLSVLTIGEMEKGIVRLPPSRRRTGLEALLDQIMLRFDSHILDLDRTTLQQWGRMTGDLEKKGRVLPVIDSLIAATALEHDLTIVTRNEDDFTPTGVKVLNLWQ